MCLVLSNAYLGDLQHDGEAARLLAEHGQVTAAVTRLMRPVEGAVRQAPQPGSAWADQDTLLQLYTYCLNLNSHWGLQQVSLAYLHVEMLNCDSFISGL